MSVREDMMNFVASRPLIGITLGDVAGVGPEVTAKALANANVGSLCRPIVIGDETEFLKAAAEIANTPPVVTAGSLIEAVELAHADRIPIWNPVRPLPTVAWGQPSAITGQAAYDWLIAATDAALANSIDAIVTAPLSKAALHAAGLKYPGHTEILAKRCRTPRHAMMLYLPPGPEIKGPHGLGIAHVTLHTSIASVPDLITREKVRATIQLVHDFLRGVGVESPRVGVCALNPHGGEAGIFGDEELRVIGPAVEEARAAGVNATGPLPTDTLIRRAVLGEFDGLAAMYHDQGHIALKLIGFGTAVNVTLGLPIVRTSPSHGTAFDIAGRGIADAVGMVQAIVVAATLAMHGRKWQPDGELRTGCS